MSENGKTDPSTDYEIGYRKPPREHRFKKGQSGNPGGRPKKLDIDLEQSVFERASSAMFQRQLQRPVTVRDGGQIKTMPALEALQMQLMNDALKGDRFARKHLVERVEREEKERVEVQTEYFKQAYDYREAGLKRLEECKLRGLPEPSLFPDPRDVNIDPLTGRVKIEGPITPEEKAELDGHLELRDLVIDRLREAINEVRSKPRNAEYRERLMAIRSALKKIEGLVPGRYKLSQTELRAIDREVNEALSGRGASRRRVTKEP